jgi:hypothetical protein
VYKAMASLGFHFVPRSLAKLLFKKLQKGFVNKDGTA